MKLRSAECFLEFCAAAEGAVEAVGAEQVFVIEDNVVNADDLMFAQLQVIEAGARLVHVHAESKVSVVVQVCPRADDPVHETGFQQRDQA
jgi:hypothetical protein